MFYISLIPAHDGTGYKLSARAQRAANLDNHEGPPGPELIIFSYTRVPEGHELYNCCPAKRAPGLNDIYARGLFDLD